MPETVSYGAAFLIGLFGSPHCLGMCGGIASLLGLSANSNNSSKGKQILFSSLFQLGRISCYGLLGLIAGIIGNTFTDSFKFLTPIFILLTSLLLLIVALSLLGLPSLTKKIEVIGKFAWKFVQPLTHKLLPVTHGHQAFLLGCCWGFLPCGLIYSTLAWATLTASPANSALLMFCFGLGTLPAVASIGSLSSMLKSGTQRPWIRTVFGLLLIAMAMLPLYTMIQHRSHHQHGNQSETSTNMPMEHHEHHH